MLNILSQLDLDQRQEITKIVQRIVDRTGAEKIYCYGSRLTHRHRCSPFQDDREHYKDLFSFCYDMLLIMPTGEQRDREEILHRVSGIFRRPYDVSCILIYQQEAIKQLEDGDRFMNDIRIQAALLYNATRQPLEYTIMRKTYVTYTQQAEAAWTQWMAQARESLAQARLSHTQGHCRLTAHLLSKSVIQVCNALIRSHTGYQPTSTRVVTLLRLCDNFCSIRAAFFPYTTPEERMLLETLINSEQLMPPDAPFVITMETCTALLIRVGKMHTMAEKYYARKMTGRPASMELPLNIS